MERPRQLEQSVTNATPPIAGQPPAPGAVDITSPGEPRRWTFILPTPGGDVNCTYHLTPDTLAFDSDSIWDGGHHSVEWSAIAEAGTAALAMPVGRGAPDLGRFVPEKLEWLIASPAGANTKPFMHPLPPAPHRDALIASVRDRLGMRWVGESIPFADARTRFKLRSGGENLKVAGIVVGVIALLFLLLLLLIVVLPLLLFPAGFALGAWLFRDGLSGLRDAISVANTPTARVSSAAIGLVELEGLAKTAHPSPAAVTGRPSVWWDIAVEAWYPDSKGGGSWRQLAARHGGTMDTLEVEDQTGRVLVWLKGADLLLTADSWEAGKDRLPAPGDALLQTLGFPWRANTRLRVRETRLEADAPVFVLGTLDERRTISENGEGGMLAQAVSLIRTGRWRDTLIRVLPRWLAMLVAVLLGYFSILFGVGRGGERPNGPHDSGPPDMAPDAVLVWKGLARRPFIVSNGREEKALSQLRTRSLYRAAAGIGVLCYCVYELLQLF